MLWKKRLGINISAAKFYNRDQATKYAKFAQVFVKSGIKHNVSSEDQLKFINTALSAPQGRAFLMGMKDDQSKVETIVEKLQSDGVPSVPRYRTFYRGHN